MDSDTKVVQVVKYENDYRLYLCEDGYLWEQKKLDDEWEEIEMINIMFNN